MTSSTGIERRSGGAFTRVDPALPGSVPAIRSALVDFARHAGLDGEGLDCLRLAVSEAVTNATLHAYRSSSGRIYSSAWVGDEELEIHIADDGCGLIGGSPRAGLGLGLGLIAQVCDGFAIAERSSGGTEIRMTFALDG